MPGRRTVVFDLGGVMLRWQPEELAHQALPDHAPDPATAATLAARLFQDFTPGGDWAEFDRGVLDLATLVDRMSARTGLATSAVHALLDAVPSHLQPQRPSVALLERLRAAGHRLVYLSNMPAPYADRLDGDPGFRGWFEAGVFSSRVGCVKPEPRIFEVAQRRLGLDPSRTLLVDDRPANLAQARRHGWSGVHFRDAEQCAGELADLGWLPE